MKQPSDVDGTLAANPQIQSLDDATRAKFKGLFGQMRWRFSNGIFEAVQAGEIPLPLRVTRRWLLEARVPSMSDRPILYIFSGLPGSGKTALSQRVARRVNGAYLRIDTIEQALRDLCSIDVQGEGYGLAYRIAADNLRLGVSVIADSCNPIELTRREWEQVALQTQARYVNIEVVCSDAHEHRRRVETRVSGVPGLKPPTWKEVERREYHEWTVDRIVIDTASKREADCFDELVSELSNRTPQLEDL